MSEAKKWIEWSPAWALHVRGRYTEREWNAEAGMHEPQAVEMICGRCQAAWKTMCASGHVRQHIEKFGLVHAHRDPLLDVPRIVRPGSLRRPGQS